MLYLGKMNLILGIDRKRKRVNIKGFAKFTKARYKSSKSILKHIRDLTKVQDDWEDNKCFGTALNEGITEWAISKMISGNESYKIEVNLVKQIENIIILKNFAKNKLVKLNVKNSKIIHKIIGVIPSFMCSQTLSPLENQNPINLL